MTRPPGGRPVDGTPALAAAAATGPYARVEPATTGGGWLPAADLATPAGLGELVAHARRTLGGARPETVEPRVAASVVFLGLAARLLGPAVAAAVLAGAVPDLALDRLSRRPATGQPIPLAATDPVAYEPGGGATLAGLVAAVVVDGPLRRLADTTAALTPVSPQVLWGNVASALAGAVLGVARFAPDRTPAAVELGRAVLRHEPLAGTGAFVPPSGSGREWTFARRSCCLLYRVPGFGVCGDCVLARRR